VEKRKIKSNNKMNDLLMIVGSCIIVSLVSIIFILIIRKKIGYEELKKNNDVAGFIYAVVSVIYAVLLAFVVIVEWEMFRETQNKVTNEVEAMSSVFRDARLFSDIEKRTSIQNALIAYATNVIEEEWPMMADQKSSPKALDQIHKVFRLVGELHPKDDYEKLWYQEMIVKMNRFSDARNQRVMCSAEGIPEFMWVMLIVLSVITIGYTFFFGISNPYVHISTVTVLCVVVTLGLLTIYAFDHPFTGIITVTPEPFVEQLKHWHGYVMKGY
jgi:magnesium-transporting ATPase (P-type)